MMSSSSNSLASSGKGIAGSGWMALIVQRVRERDIRHRLIYDSVGKKLAGGFQARRLSNRIPAIAEEYAKTSLAAIIAFWLIAHGLALAFRIDAMIAYAVFGLIYAFQSSYYAYRLKQDPNYRIPRCACAKVSRYEHSERVLTNPTGLISWIPLSVPAAFFYGALLPLRAYQNPAAVFVLALLGFSVTLWLGYVMVFRLRSLCANCINMGALNALILLASL